MSKLALNQEGDQRPVIQASHLDLTFQTADGPVHALKDVSLDIPKGAFVSFIGPSGCGKTTLLRCIAALETPTGGSLTVNGMSADEARRARAYGYVFQAAGLYPWRTIGRNIALPLEIMGFSKAEQAERIARVLDLVELSGFENKFPWQLSGGMQQRASIARALAFDADILLMDEPFGALDPVTRDDLQEEFDSLRRRLGLTAVLVTHDMTEALLLADRIAILRDGELLMEDTPQGLMSKADDEYIRRLLHHPRTQVSRLREVLGDDFGSGDKA